jgi:hypothetical protein
MNGSARAGLASREERVAAVHALIGTPNPSVRHLALGICAAAHRHFDEHVFPLAAAHWPELEGLPFRHKLRIDGLLFPVVRYAGEGARAWMYDVSLFVQIVDDWLDAEADRASDRSTPVLAGAWGMDEVEAAWQRTLDGLGALLRDAGLGSPRYVRFVREAYVLMMVEVLEAMIARPDG